MIPGCTTVDTYPKSHREGGNVSIRFDTQFYYTRRKTPPSDIESSVRFSKVRVSFSIPRHVTTDLSFQEGESSGPYSQGVMIL